MHVFKVGCRWVDCPKEYGPSKTICNRFARWSEHGFWRKIFETVAAPSEPPEQVALDSCHVKAHRRASGGKGGPNFRRSGSRKPPATTGSPQTFSRPSALSLSSEGEMTKWP